MIGWGSVHLAIQAATASPAPQNTASSLMPSSSQTVLSTSKHTACAWRHKATISANWIGQIASYKIGHCPCVPTVYLPKLHIQVKHVPHQSRWALTSRSLHDGGVANCFQFIKGLESSYCYSISFCIPTGEAYWISVHQRNWGWMAQCLHWRWIHVLNWMYI